MQYSYWTTARAVTINQTTNSVWDQIDSEINSTWAQAATRTIVPQKSGTWKSSKKHFKARFKALLYVSSKHRSLKLEARFTAFGPNFKARFFQGQCTRPLGSLFFIIPWLHYNRWVLFPKYQANLLREGILTCSTLSSETCKNALPQILRCSKKKVSTQLLLLPSLYCSALIVCVCLVKWFNTVQFSLWSLRKLPISIHTQKRPVAVRVFNWSTQVE